MTALLEAQGLSKSFGATRALEDIDLAIDEGEIVGIIGPNGSGKTTFFNCVSGRMKPTRGTVTWCGVNITGASMHKVARLGLVRTFQEPMTFPSGTTRFCLDMAFAISASHPGSHERVNPLPADTDSLLEFSGLGDVANRLSSTLPFGSLRQLGIAMAVAAQPRMLMLDEPAAGLNAVESASLQALLRRVHELGLTLVIIDHDMDFLLPLVERAVAFASGKKIADAAPREVAKDPAVIEVYLGASAAQIEQLGGGISRAEGVAGG